MTSTQCWRASRLVLGAMLGVCVAMDSSANQSTESLVRFGKTLFDDVALSADGTVSCATCHSESSAFTDGRRVAVGIAGKSGVRNTPSLRNAAMQSSFSWDGRASSLEQQVLAPLTNPNEHGLSSLDMVVSVVRASDRYRDFAEAKNATAGDVANALAEYVRSLGSCESRFDQYLLRGNKSALSPQERAGFELFKGPGGCTSCHRIDPPNAALTDNGFHRVSHLPKELMNALADKTVQSVNASPSELERLITSDASVAALGRFNVTREPRDIGKYRTPSLKNAAITAPYMHDGSVATLEEAVDAEIYYRGIESGTPLILTPQERKSVVTFLRSLTCVSLETVQGKQ